MESRWNAIVTLKASDLGALEIIEVKTRRQLGEFVRLPRTIYCKNPYWVPPLDREVKKILSAENPFYQHAEKTLYLARRGSRPVGRIAAVIDQHYIRIHKEKVGFFGFFESLDDNEVARALMGTAANWLRERGMTAVLGPINPSTNEECGFLIDGFDSAPSFMMPYNPPYYLSLMERLQFLKIKELLAYRMTLDREMPEWVPAMVGRIAKRTPGLVVRPINLKDFPKEIERFKEIYNSAWEQNWGFVPMTDEEFDFMAKRMRPLIVADLTFLAMANGEPAGFNLTLPDYNQALVHLEGSLFPFGWLKFLRHQRKITRVRSIAVGVREPYRKTGLIVLLFLESLKACSKFPYREAEISWILEDNVAARRAAEMAGAIVYKRYALYKKDIA